MVEEYATPPFSYEQEHIGALRAACAEVAAAAEPGHRDLTRLQRAVMLLIGLADYTGNRHDAGPNLPPYDPRAAARPNGKTIWVALPAYHLLPIF